MNYRLFSLMCLQICVISALKDLSVKIEVVPFFQKSSKKSKNISKNNTNNRKYSKYRRKMNKNDYENYLEKDKNFN
ncbi:hypothetical protein H8356DRAFT_1330584 [Neocallimastix lanati (nom. inval.)]|nr:hypothetical protein H8356DRAFT_1330584 [Neocallimastix sp. JGI-2020a]